jgi:hypothetical protein
VADERHEPIPSGSLAVLAAPQDDIHPAARAIAEDHVVKVPLDYPLDLAQRLTTAWRAIRATVSPGLDAPEREEMIRQAFESNQCLPTQWLAGLVANRIASDKT